MGLNNQPSGKAPDFTDNQIDEVIAEYMRRVDAGETVQQDHFLTQHPHLRTELREFFGNVNLVGKGPYSAARPESHKLIIRCPECQSTVSFKADSDFVEVACKSCGTAFSIVGDGERTAAAPTLATIAHFQLIERIGVGGFGTVWKAFDSLLERMVAVKIPRRAVLNSDDSISFLREARTAAQLRHPNIVSTYEVGRHEDSIYIVSDFIHGATLDDWLAMNTLSVREAAGLCIKIAGALHYAHQQRVIHRDLKPGNILMDSGGEPHIADFGLARRELGDLTLTIDGHVMGTPAYMSPEQAQGSAHTADRRTDIYSLGVILFQLLTGEIPFRGNFRMLMHQVMHDEPPSPRKFNANIPADLETITLKCLEKDPDARYATADEVASELKRFLNGQPICARPLGTIARSWRWCKRKPSVASLAASLIIAVSVGIAATAMMWTEATHQRSMAEFFNDKTQQFIDLLYTDHSGYYGASSSRSLNRSMLNDAVIQFQQVVAANPRDPKAKRNLAKSLLRLCDASRANGLVDEAVDESQQAVRVSQAVYDMTAETQDLASLAIAWERVGIAGSGIEALHAIERAYDANCKLMGASSDPTYTFLAGRNCFNLAFRIMDRDQKKAIMWLERAIDHLSSAAQESDEKKESTELLAYSYELLGTIHSTGESPEQAIPLFVRARELRQGIVKEHPEAMDALSCLAETHNKMGLIQQQQQSPDDALKSLQDCVAIREKILNFQLVGDEIVTAAKMLIAGYDNLSRNEMPHEMALSLFERLELLRTRMDLRSEQFSGEDWYHYGTAYFNTGANLEMVRDHRNALACYDRAVEWLRAAMDSDVETDWSRDLATAEQRQQAMQTLLNGL